MLVASRRVGRVEILTFALLPTHKMLNHFYSVCSRKCRDRLKCNDKIRSVMRKTESSYISVEIGSNFSESQFEWKDAFEGPNNDH